MLGRYLPNISIVKFEEPFFKQSYFDGDFCELINTQRLVDIVYKCKNESSDELKLIEVIETSVCKYIAYIHVPSICSRKSSTKISCVQDLNIDEQSFAPNLSKFTPDIVDMKRSFLAFKLISILSLSDNNFPLTQIAIHYLSNIILEHDSPNTINSNLIKFMQVMGIDLNNVVFSSNISEINNKKDDGKENKNKKE